MIFIFITTYIISNIYCKNLSSKCFCHLLADIAECIVYCLKYIETSLYAETVSPSFPITAVNKTVILYEVINPLVIFFNYANVPNPVIKCKTIVIFYNIMGKKSYEVFLITGQLKFAVMSVIIIARTCILIIKPNTVIDCLISDKLMLNKACITVAFYLIVQLNAAVINEYIDLICMLTKKPNLAIDCLIVSSTGESMFAITNYYFATVKHYFIVMYCHQTKNKWCYNKINQNDL